MALYKKKRTFLSGNSRMRGLYCQTHNFGFHFDHYSAINGKSRYGISRYYMSTLRFFDYGFLNISKWNWVFHSDS